MAQDEAATLKTLNAHRGLMGGLIRQHGGRVVDAVGDNLLAEFPSVVDAVACAVAVQEGLAVRNAERSDDRQMPFRIGIHLGDVMVEGDAIVGDGVNIAARIEALADSGGICVSATVHEQIRDKLSHRYEDLGEQSLKNIAHPVRVYRVRLAEGEKADEAASLTVPGFAGRPAIAVLAFDNLSGDPEQEYFADGIAEDLITHLSDFRLFPVIARNSSFTYKGKPVDVKQVSRELGVRYVVEGSVRKAGDRVRVSAQLIDATTGHHVWAQRYDREYRDIFDLQDELTQTIIGALEPTLERVERERAGRQPTGNLDAWDCLQRGLWHLHKYNEEDIATARSCLCKACELDPQFSQAFAALAMSYLVDLAFARTESPRDTLRQAIDVAEQAVALAPDDASARTVLAATLIMRGDSERAHVECEKATRLNPCFPDAYAEMGRVLTLMSRPAEAVSMIEKAIRLSPHDSLLPVWYIFLGYAHLVAGHYKEVVHHAKDSLAVRSDLPVAYRLLAAALGYLGRSDEARQALDEMYKIAPNFTVKGFREFAPPGVAELLVQGWRKAGWKEDKQG